MKICPACRKDFPDDQLFCGDCGTKLEEKPLACAKCGRILSPEDKFCSSCGTKVSSDGASSARDNLAQVSKTATSISNKILSDENINRIKDSANSILASDNVVQAKERVQGIVAEGRNRFLELPARTRKIIAGAIVGCIVIVGGYYWFSPTKQVERAVEHSLDCLAEAVSSDDIDDSVNFYNTLTPEIRDDYIKRIDMLKQDDRFAEKYKKKTEKNEEKFKGILGVERADILLNRHIVGVIVEGNRAKVLVHSDSDANLEAVGLKRDNAFSLKKIDGAWYIEKIEGWNW